MDNSQASNTILFNNKLYQKRPSSKALCLNPNCKANRLCKIEAEGNPTLVNHQDHQTCGGWFHSISKLRKWHLGEDQMQLGSIFSTDYFENPIESIYYMEAFGSLRWEDHLFSYFGTIKTAIEEELSKLYIKCQRNINDHLSANKDIFAKLNSFYQNGVNHQQGIEQYYKQHLQKELRAIQQNGIIHISNNELMKRSLDSIIEQIQSMELCVWGKEFKHDLSERIKIKTQKQEMMKFAMQSDPQDINSKINQILILLKSPLQYIEEEKGLKVSCAICSKNIFSQAQNTKQRKQQCRTLLLHHMSNYHLEQVSMMLGQHPPIKLSMEGFEKEIKLKNVKKVIVVDKQNVGSINCEEWYLYPDYYFLQVVSQHSEKNAKGRYLVAESKGRDAADILMVIVLTELSKMNMEEIVLLTKDHFGQTLRSLFKGMGISLILSHSLDVLDQPKRMTE